MVYCFSCLKILCASDDSTRPKSKLSPVWSTCFVFRAPVFYSLSFLVKKLEDRIGIHSVKSKLCMTIIFYIEYIYILAFLFILICHFECKLCNTVNHTVQFFNCYLNEKSVSYEQGRKDDCCMIPYWQKYQDVRSLLGHIAYSHPYMLQSLFLAINCFSFP